MAESFRLKWAIWQPERLNDTVLAANAPRPRSVLSPYLGRPYTLAEVQAPHRCKEPGMESFFAPEETLHRMAVVRAYEVSHLMGATYEARDEADVYRALERFLATALPGFDWRIETDGIDTQDLLFKKYQVVIAHLDAADDLAMEQPTSLEIEAKMVAAGGIELRKTAYAEWMMNRIQKYMETFRYESIPGPIVMQITQATYANVAATRIGIGSYG